MRARRIVALLALGTAFLMPFVAGAQTVDADHTAEEVANGQALAAALRDGSIACASLPDEDFVAIGEYAMNLMVGDGHAAMNAMMTRMMGEEGEWAMHVVLGKRWSDCDPTASYPSTNWGAFPMMGMMGAFANRSAEWNWWWMGGIGVVVAIVALVIVVGAAVVLVRWVVRQAMGIWDRKRSAREVLDARYARGEITKAEYREKRKDVDGE